MSRWWRAYDEAVDDPKLQRIGPALGWAWFNLMCIASKNDGALPSIGDVAFKLRTTEQKAAATIAALVSAGLFDKREDGRYAPHNWSGRQYKGDVTDATNAERQKRYRERHRNGVTNVTVGVTPKRPETETETETETKKTSEANASGATAPDPRTRLFSEGLAKIAELTGKGPDSCRTFVGKCLKESSDDASVVLGIIDDAYRNRVADAGAWIMARVKGAKQVGGVPSVDWDAVLSAYKKTGHWSRYAGNDPSSPGCRCPPEILAKYGLLIHSETVQ